MAFPTTPVDAQIYNTTDGRRYKYSLARDSWEFDTSVSNGLINNFSAVSPPTLTDSSSSGYGIGSIWVDILAKKSYMNVSPVPGAAVWEALGSTVQNNYASVIAPAGADNSTLGYSIGSEWIDTLTGFTYKCVNAAGVAVWNRTS